MNLKETLLLFNIIFKDEQILTPFLIGSPGIGKSTIVKNYANINNLKLIDLRLSQLDSVDLRGIPRPDVESGTSKWYPPDFLPFKGFSNWENTSGILFLDEINRARPDVLQSVFQLVLDRKVGEYELLDSWYIIAAGNRGIDDNCDIVDFDDALKSRFIFIDVENTLSEWLVWARSKKLNNDMLVFLECNPSYFIFNSKTNSNVVVNPRTWEKLSNLTFKNNMSLYDVNEVLGKDLLGEAFLVLKMFLKDKESIGIMNILNSFSKNKNKLKNNNEYINYRLLNELKTYILNNNKYSKRQIKNISKFLYILSEDKVINFINDILDCNNDKAIILSEIFDSNDKLDKKIQNIIISQHGIKYNLLNEINDKLLEIFKRTKLIKNKKLKNIILNELSEINNGTFFEKIL